MDSSSLPPSWQVEFGPTAPPRGKSIRGELDGAYVQFDCRQVGTATHVVGRYGTVPIATVSFYAYDAFPSGDWLVSPWATPDGWTYQSEVASRFKLACGEIVTTGPPVLSCKAVAQYDEFISEFTATLSPECMTLEDLQSVLNDIDARMAEHLGPGAE